MLKPFRLQVLLPEKVLTKTFIVQNFLSEPKGESHERTHQPPPSP
jgi:hypothetical protein